MEKPQLSAADALSKELQNTPYLDEKILILIGRIERISHNDRKGAQRVEFGGLCTNLKILATAYNDIYVPQGNAGLFADMIPEPISAKPIKAGPTETTEFKFF